MTVRNQATIVVTGWLNNVKNFEWGTALTVAVDVRKMNEAGEYETVDRVNYDVTTDQQFKSDARQIQVTGRITGLNTYAKKDGTTGVSVKVRAEALEEPVDTAPDSVNDLPF
jgi:hypothetical protein